MSDHSKDRDVIDTLVTDHREATELIEQIFATTDASERRDLADSLIAELVRHAVVEEMYVYPAMREHLPDGKAAVEHDTKEHDELEVQMKQLESVEAADPQLLAIVRKLQGKMDDHVKDEEQDQFPKLRLHVPETTLVELKGKVEKAKKIVPTRPHPSAPNAELFHKTVGPGVGLVDRLRDKLTGRAT
jgi:iron-sulfur cluster repair protein YtfE (RIC family)